MTDYTDRRINPRRSASDRRQDDPEMNDRLYTMILDRLNNIEQGNRVINDSTKGDRVTFTIPQILTALVAVVTIGGSLLAAWVNINNQITAQKVGTDLSISQIQKDIAYQVGLNKEFNARMDTHVVNVQTSIDKITNRIDDLDNTINQLYNRSNNQKK